MKLHLKYIINHRTIIYETYFIEQKDIVLIPAVLNKYINLKSIFANLRVCTNFSGDGCGLQGRRR